MEEINIKTLLPVGEKLKPLLSKSCISEADLKGILAERGVFIGDNSKQMSIPLLTLSIISPKEFEKLQEFQKTKEDSVKFRTSKIESSTSYTLNTFMTSSPRWLMTLTAMRPDVGLSKGREMSLLRESQHS